MDRVEIGTILVVLLLLTSQGAVVVAQTLSHSATGGTVYETNSGLTVTLGNDREVDASPFDGDTTFADSGIRISAPGSAAVTVDDQTYGGTSMSAAGIDATTNPVTFERGDVNTVTVDGGATNVKIFDMTLDDGSTDLEIAAASSTTVTIEGLPDTDGIQAVDSSGTVQAGDTDTSDNAATLNLDAGTYALRLQDGPSQLEIRDLVNQTLVKDGTNITVEVEFFGDDGFVEQRTTTDGVIDMTGLPADERFSVSVDAGDKYVARQIIIPSLLNQQTAYLLPQSTDIDTVEPRFTLEDPSNQFDEQASEIVLERPIDRGNGTEFVAVAGDRIGINGYDVILERDQRYRVTVTDPDSGAQRTLGEFTPTQSEPVTLTVADVEFDSVATVDGLEWTARYLENENALNEIEFIFRDSFETQSLQYTIYERGNKTNVLATGSASGNVTVTETIPAGQEDRVWTVEWEATRGSGETLSATRPVSTDSLPVGPPSLPGRWQTIAAMLGLFGVAGLFGAANPGIGGIAVASTGGLFWLIGWLPDQTGGLMVVLALFIAVLSYAGRRARGAQA